MRRQEFKYRENGDGETHEVIQKPLASESRIKKPFREINFSFSCNFWAAATKKGQLQQTQQHPDHGMNCFNISADEKRECSSSARLRSRHQNEVWDLKSPTPVQCKFNGLHKPVSSPVWPLPAKLQPSFRLELFSTDRHAVLSLKGAAFKIFIKLHPTVMSFPLVSTWGASLSHQEGAGTTGNLCCHSISAAHTAWTGQENGEQL